MILSCQKHKNTRLKEFSLSKTSYNNWEVIYVIGDLFLKENYILDGNFLYVRCEDSYLHLLKKLILAMKSVKELFNIKFGKNYYKKLGFHIHDISALFYIKQLILPDDTLNIIILILQII